MEYIINDFIKEVKEALIDENEDRKNCGGKKQLDLPFIISSLQQRLSDDELVEFIKDISVNRYSLQYEDVGDEYYDYGKLNVSLFEQEIVNDELCYTYLDYSYSIIFCYDPREWEYCQCEPTDRDYIEDKHCCGHGCDWWAPAFRIIKEISIGHQHSWNGDQHDYWKYEESFYKSDLDLASEKAKKDKEDKIKYLSENIKQMQEELHKLQTI